jgi:hypothetical protein
MLSLTKPGENTEAILKTCELIIYGTVHCITDSFCENVLKVSTLWPPVVNCVLLLIFFCHYF